MDRVVFLEGAGVRLAVCSAAGVAREASARHGLKAGSAAALAQGLVGSLLVAATEKARVDVQLECGGPLRGLLADADESGAVRGLVRVNDLDVALAARPSRFDARPILATPHDEKAGLISILRAREGEQSAHRAAFPFAGADLGAALTFFLRNDRALGGELALEVLVSAEEPLAAAAGALLWGASEDDEQRVRPLGKPLRQGALHRALVRSADAHRLARSAPCARSAPPSCATWPKRMAALPSPAIFARQSTRSPPKTCSASPPALDRAVAWELVRPVC